MCNIIPEHFALHVYLGNMLDFHIDRDYLELDNLLRIQVTRMTYIVIYLNHVEDFRDRYLANVLAICT